MINSQEDLGKEYSKILDDVIAIRKKRRELYGDSYMEMPSVGHFWHAFNKIKRLKYNLENSNQKENNKKYESAKDNAIDIINYMIFFLILMEKENEY